MKEVVSAEDDKVLLAGETLDYTLSVYPACLNATVVKEFNKRVLSVSCVIFDVLKSRETLYYYIFVFLLCGTAEKTAKTSIERQYAHFTLCYVRS